MSGQPLTDAQGGENPPTFSDFKPEPLALGQQPTHRVESLRGVYSFMTHECDRREMTDHTGTVVAVAHYNARTIEKPLDQHPEWEQFKELWLLANPEDNCAHMEVHRLRRRAFGHRTRQQSTTGQR